MFRPNIISPGLASTTLFTFSNEEAYFLVFPVTAPSASPHETMHDAQTTLSFLIIRSQSLSNKPSFLCNLLNKKKSTSNEFNRLKKAVNYANVIGLDVHAGHGITFESAKILSKIKGIKEYNIGHFLIGESIFLGLKKTIKKFKSIIN